MFGFGERNYASIVAPLKQMASDLANYVAEQKSRIDQLLIDKAEIETNIAVSESEIEKSNFTTGKINELLGSDLDEDGIPDVEEIPPVDPTEGPTEEDPVDPQQ